MNILVACEESGRVRDALIAKGHKAVSCDLLPSRTPGPHYQCDVREVLGDKWDGLVAHPVCKYLANSGVQHLHKEKGRWKKMRDGAAFFLLFHNAKHIPLRAVENPIMHKYAIAIVGRKADQYVQPYMFGDPFQKATGFWLTGLPPLIPKYTKDDYEPGEIKQECWLMPPGPERERLRSTTYPGIAKAIAAQWFK